MATANILSAMDAGCHWLEGAICGIGGGMAIPSSVGSCGNFPMEDLVTMLAECGVATGIDPIACQEAAREIGARLGVPVASHRGGGATREIIAKKGRENPNDPQVRG
jgi:hydroxymethylglutaryl-CoA lyase